MGFSGNSSGFGESLKFRPSCPKTYHADGGQEMTVSPIVKKIWRVRRSSKIFSDPSSRKHRLPGWTGRKNRRATAAACELLREPTARGASIRGEDRHALRRHCFATMALQKPETVANSTNLRSRVTIDFPRCILKWTGRVKGWWRKDAEFFRRRTLGSLRAFRVVGE